LSRALLKNYKILAFLEFYPILMKLSTYCKVIV
jgi:hypothetical protein